MRGMLPSLATALLVTLRALSVTASMATEPAPEELLASRGLKRSGMNFVVQSESELIPKVAKLQPDYRKLKNLYDQLAAAMQIQAEYDLLDDRWTVVNEQLRNVQAEIDAHPPTSNNELKQSWQNLLDAERQLRLVYNELRREVNLRYKRLVPEAEREQLQRDFLKQRDDFLETSRELREQADKIKDTYNTLSRDDGVKKSLDAIKVSTKARVSLGPSPDFKKASAWLINAVRSTSPESLAPKANKKNSKSIAKGKSAAKGKLATAGKERSSKSAQKGSGDNAAAPCEPAAKPK